jgi:hypothetical protein
LPRVERGAAWEEMGRRRSGRSMAASASLCAWEKEVGRELSEADNR